MRTLGPEPKEPKKFPAKEALSKSGEEVSGQALRHCEWLFSRSGLAKSGSSEEAKISVQRGKKETGGLLQMIESSHRFLPAFGSRDRGGNRAHTHTRPCLLQTFVPCPSYTCLGSHSAFLFHCRLLFPQGHETSPGEALLSHPAQEHARLDSTTSSCTACARQDRLVFQVPISAVTVPPRDMLLSGLRCTCTTTRRWKTTHTYSCSELTHFNISFKCFFKH